jgi:hypothetical protein
MPVVTEERITERRKSRGAKAFYLLLVPPLLLLGLLAAAMVRPVVLQVGPLVVVALTGHAAGGPNFGAGGSPIPVTVGRPLDLEGQAFVVTGRG